MTDPGRTGSFERLVKDTLRETRSDLSESNLAAVSAEISKEILESTRPKLAGMNLSRSDLSGASLSGADLHGADLAGAKLNGASLVNANLSRASLSGADLSGADLTGADLSGADLAAASLNDAIMVGVNLEGANLVLASLAGANLTSAKLATGGGSKSETASDLPQTLTALSWSDATQWPTPEAAATLSSYSEQMEGGDYLVKSFASTRAQVAVVDSGTTEGTARVPSSGTRRVPSELSALSRLAALAMSGDRRAIESLIETVHTIVYRYSRAKLRDLHGSTDAADDVAQEVCIAVLSALPRYREEGRPFEAFVYKVAANKLADAQRAAYRQPLPVADLESFVQVTDRPDQEAEHLTDAMALRQLLDALPEGLREVLVLRVGVGMSIEATGAALNISPGAVRVAQYRAVQRLRSLAADKGGLEVPRVMKSGRHGEGSGQDRGSVGEGPLGAAN